jgi:transcriptional regulator with XRE-family HTH domain
MFEIGNSLREARLRQGLDLAEIEQATKIRSRYLRALEEEQFELLPAQTYVKGFLKAYADQLGLDGDLYVEEFNSRYATWEEEQPIQRGRGGGTWPPPVRFASSAVLISLTAIGLATALVVLAWRFGATGEPEDIPGVPPPAVEQNSKQATRAQKTKPRSQPAAQARRVTLVAVAALGDCWLEVHRGSEAGEFLYSGTLELGQRQKFTGRRLWINIGAPANLVLRVNGKRRPVPGSSEPHAVVVNRKGQISLAST